MKVQSLKIFKTTKNLFYKQFDSFCELTGPIMGLREPCPLQYYCCKTVITIVMHAFEWTVENDYESLNIFCVKSLSTWVPMLF